MRSMIPFVVLAACSTNLKDDPLTGGTNTDPTPTGPTGTMVDCDATMAAISPEAGEVSVPIDVVVEVTFSEAVPGRGWALTIAGVEGLARLAADGLSATFVPDTDLSPDTEYTVEAGVCGAYETSVFTTVGVAIDPVDVEGNTYAVAWGELTFTEPPNGGSLLAGGVEFDDVLLQLVDIDSVTLEAHTAAAISRTINGATTPMCTALVEEVADFSGNPAFTFGPQTVQVPVSIDANGNVLGWVDVEALTLDAEVAPDGQSLTDVALSGLIPTEPLLGDACAVSPLVALVKGTCQDCAASDSGLCLLVEATVPEADLLVGFDLLGECGG